MISSQTRDEIDVRTIMAATCVVMGHDGGGWDDTLKGTIKMKTKHCIIGACHRPLSRAMAQGGAVSMDSP